MDTAIIKEELKLLIDKEDDPAVLDAIKELLSNPPVNSVLQEKLISRALKSLEDIRAGRVFTKEEVIKRTNHLVGK
jgi:hypothetical protein